MQANVTSAAIDVSLVASSRKAAPQSYTQRPAAATDAKRFETKKRDEAWIGDAAAILSEVAADAIAAIIDMSDAIKRRFVERVLKIAAAATRGGAGVGAGAGAGCRVDPGNELKPEWVLQGRGFVKLDGDEGRMFDLRMLVHTGCTTLDQDIITTRHNARILGMKNAVCFLSGRRVKSTALIADNSWIRLVKQAPQLDLLVPLYAPHSNTPLRPRAAKMTVWVIDEKARTSDGGAALNSDRLKQWMGNLQVLGDLDMMVGPYCSGYMSGGGGRSSGGRTESSSISQDEDLSSVQDMHDGVGDGCQLLSPVGHDNKGHFIIGLEGLAKLDLLMDPTNRMVSGVRINRRL